MAKREGEGVNEGFLIDSMFIPNIVSKTPAEIEEICLDITKEFTRTRRDEFLINPKVAVMPTPMREVPSKDEYYISLLPVIASRSKDTNQVGCLFVGDRGEIRATGYNGFPSDVTDTVERWQRPRKYDYVAHAEINCIAHAARVGTPVYGCTAYVSFAPCKDCAKALINAGIYCVIVDAANHARVTSERWERDAPIVREMFEEATVGLLWFKDGKIQEEV
jgi:dCMP deaminase